MSKSILRAIFINFLIALVVSICIIVFISFTGNCDNYAQSSRVSDRTLIVPLATFSFPFQTATPTPTLTPEPTPTPVPTPKPILPTPTLSVVCKGSSTPNGLKVEVYGALQSNSSGIPEAPILVGYSINGSSWESISLVQTRSDGSFTAIWVPPAMGSYIINASFGETFAYNAANKTVNVAFLSDSGQNTLASSIVTVNSNSPLIESAFNSTLREIVFVTTGSADAIGYVSVYIPKNLASDISNLKTYLDRNPLSVESESQGDSWLVCFTYAASESNITMVLPAESKLPFIGESTPDWLLYGVAIMVGVIIVACLVALIRHRRRMQRYKKYIASYKNLQTP